MATEIEYLPDRSEFQNMSSFELEALYKRLQFNMELLGAAIKDQQSIDVTGAMAKRREVMQDAWINANDYGLEIKYTLVKRFVEHWSEWK